MRLGVEVASEEVRVIKVSRLFIAGVAVGLAVAVVGYGLVRLQPRDGRGFADASAPAGDRRGGGPQAGGQGGGRGGAQGGPGGMAPAITTAAVSPAAIGRTIEAVGAGRAAKSVTLVAEATGLVETVAHEAGDAVKPGEVILKIDDAEQRIAVARARAQYPVAKANNERYAALYKEDSASKLEADNAFNAYKAAEAELRAAEYALRQRTIVAPFEGVVGLTSIEAGDYVRSGDVVTTIDDLSALIVEFAAPQEAAAFVAVGQAVEASLAGAGGERMTGTISAVDSRIDSASRTLKVEATFSGAGGTIIPGATYAVTTTNEGAAALSMPGLAVQWDRTGAYVWKLGSDRAAVRAGVRVLQRRDDVAVVDGEVKAGDLVVVEGADRVRPGMKFPATEAAAPERQNARAVGTN
jgi:RND family efflux transporter MFP subunit